MAILGQVTDGATLPTTVQQNITVVGSISGVTDNLVVCGNGASGLQSIAGIGSAGEVLTSNGAGALPTFQAAAGGGGWTYVSTTSGDDILTALTIDGLSANTRYKIELDTVDHTNTGVSTPSLYAQFREGGATKTDSDYSYSVTYTSYSTATVAGSQDTTNMVILPGNLYPGGRGGVQGTLFFSTGASSPSVLPSIYGQHVSINASSAAIHNTIFAGSLEYLDTMDADGISFTFGGTAFTSATKLHLFKLVTS